MKRFPVSHIRKNWQAKLEEVGFHFYEMEGKPYWDESAFYELTADEVDRLEDVTDELYRMGLELVERVVREGLYEKLAIPPAFRHYVEASWKTREPSIYGRFDLWYDGHSDPKLLEFNADTPTALFEASIVQYYWLQDYAPKEDQFNSIHEKLLDVFQSEIRGAVGQDVLYFSCVKDTLEDLTTTEYLRDLAIQAGIVTNHIYIDEVGWDLASRQFVDLETKPINKMFKLYPWEWIITESFADRLLASTLRLLEPAWKMILSNKGILPLLWEMYPNHPNLLASFFEPPNREERYVEKPFFSREGENVRTGSWFLRRGKRAIYQEYKELPDFEGNYPVIGSWIIGDRAAGIGIREDTTPITNNMSRFVPHLFRAGT
jgi:glutathionylspermidine synthase